MLESTEDRSNVVRYGDIYKPLFVVPFDGEFAVVAACPVYRNIVFLLKCIEEVVDMSFVKIFYSKVINCEGEDDMGCSMASLTRSVLDQVVTT